MYKQFLFVLEEPSHVPLECPNKRGQHATNATSITTPN
jgi:hypothetical protein